MAPNLALTLWDPHFLCLSWRGMGLSFLTHQVGRWAAPRRLQYVCSRAHHVCVRVCVSVCLCTWARGRWYTGECEWWLRSLVVFLGSARLLNRFAGVCRLHAFVSGLPQCVCWVETSSQELGTTRCIFRHQLLLASARSISLRFCHEGAGSARRCVQRRVRE